MMDNTTPVATSDGIVAALAANAMTGIAKNETEKALVTKLVTDIRGVSGVKNQMTIEEIKTK